MEEELYIQMRQLEDNYWWFVGKRLFVFNFIKGNPERVLDLGCGTGVMIECLNTISNKVIGIDNSLLAISYTKNRLHSKKLIVCDSRNISIKDNVFDLVIASDLVEHISDDEIVLSEAKRVLKKGGKLIVTVPAFDFLWSIHDKTAHHVRRYTVDLLKTKVEKIKLRIEKISYTNIFIFPFVFLLRSLRNFIPFYKSSTNDFFYTPAFLNTLFIYCYKLEAVLLKKFDFPFGVSILGVFVKT